jgi:hypothetical protein
VAINVRKISLIITIATLFVIITGYAPTANASSKSPYESGYDHGCDDADISDPDDRYINQPEKGPSFHTNEFMRGYNDGYDSCSEQDADDDSSGDSSPSSNGGIVEDVLDACQEILDKSRDECTEMGLIGACDLLAPAVGAPPGTCTGISYLSKLLRYIDN